MHTHGDTITATCIIDNRHVNDSEKNPNHKYFDTFCIKANLQSAGFSERAEF